MYLQRARACCRHRSQLCSCCVEASDQARKTRRPARGWVTRLFMRLSTVWPLVFVMASRTCRSIAWRSVRVAWTSGNSCRQGGRQAGGQAGRQAGGQAAGAQPVSQGHCARQKVGGRGSGRAAQRQSGHLSSCHLPQARPSPGSCHWPPLTCHMTPSEQGGVVREPV